MSDAGNVKCMRCGHKREHHYEGTDIRTEVPWRGCVVNVAGGEGMHGCQCQGFEAASAEVNAPQPTEPASTSR